MAILKVLKYEYFLVYKHFRNILCNLQIQLTQFSDQQKEWKRRKQLKLIFSFLTAFVGIPWHVCNAIWFLLASLKQFKDC